MVIWSAFEDDNWRLKARTWDGKAFGSTETITQGDGKNLFHRAVGDGKGNVHVVYQSWRRLRSDIFLRSYVNGSWRGEVNLSDPKRPVRANDWFPSVGDCPGRTQCGWRGMATDRELQRVPAVRAQRIGWSAVAGDEQLHDFMRTRALRSMRRTGFGSPTTKVRRTGEKTSGFC